MRSRAPTRLRDFAVFIFLVFALNFVWEMAQGGLFAGMTALPFWTATRRCLMATVGDVGFTAIAFGISSAVARRVDWAVSPARRGAATVVFLLSGLLLAVLYERWALATGRWMYTGRMPVVLGIGVSPLAQWVVLPSLELVILKYLWTRAR